MYPGTNTFSTFPWSDLELLVNHLWLKPENVNTAYVFFTVILEKEY